MDAIVQYVATTYWGIILTGNLLVIFFIAFWVHTATMTKRYKQLEERFNRLENGMVYLRNALQPSEQPPMHYQPPPMQQQAATTQQFSQPYQPPQYQ